jgi:hypothetical protein
MNKLTDKDLREALRRREARRTEPEVPADFCDNVMQEIAPKPAHRPRYAYIAALAAAACIVFAVLMVWPSEDKENSVESKIIVRKEQAPRPLPTDGQEKVSIVQPVKATIRQTKRADRQLVAQQNIVTATDSLDYYINKIERELAQMDDSLYIERIHRVMHADERLQRIVNNYILNELHKDAKSSEANNINNVKTDEDEE